MANLTTEMDDFRCDRCHKHPIKNDFDTYIIGDNPLYRHCCIKCDRIVRPMYNSQRLRELSAEMQRKPVFESPPTNVPPIPPVQRARLGRWRVIPHTISIYWRLRVQRLKLAILEWLGVDQLIKNEVNSRRANDQTMLHLINRHATQVNAIAQSLPSLVEAKKRLEFYENDEILRHALKRFNKANPTLTLEKKHAGTQADGQAHDHRGRAGTVGEVSKGPGPDAAVEDGQAGVRRPDADGALEGRPEVPGQPSAEILTGLRDPFIAEMIDADEAATFTKAAVERRLDLEQHAQSICPFSSDGRHRFAEYKSRYILQCVYCGKSSLNEKAIDTLQDEADRVDREIDQREDRS